MTICGANCIYIGWQGMLLGFIVGALWLGAVYALAWWGAKVDAEHWKAMRELRKLEEKHRLEEILDEIRKQY